MTKREKAEEICEELGLDYYNVYNEGSGSVSAKFLNAVHGEVEDKKQIEGAVHKKEGGLTP